MGFVKPYLPVTMGWYSAADGDETPWLSVDDYVLYRCYDESLQGQGNAIMQVTSSYEEGEAPWVRGKHWGAEDVYLEWFMTATGQEGACGPNPGYHFCAKATKSCAEVSDGSTQDIHIDFYKIIDVEEARVLLRSWGTPVLPDAPPLPEPKSVKKKKKPGPKKKVPKVEEIEDDEEEEEVALKPDKKRKSIEDVKGPASAKGKKKGKKLPDNLLDEELADLVTGLQEDGADEIKEPNKKSEVANKLEALKAKLQGRPAVKPMPGVAASAGKKEGLRAVLLARASDQGNKQPEGTVADELGDNNLARMLLQALKKSSGSGSMEGSSEEGDDEISSKLETKRTLLRKIAKQKPGYLLTKALQGMREQVTSMTGEDGSDPYEPVCLRYFLSVFLPNHRELPEPTLREVRTLAEAVDGLLRGKTVEVGDLLAQRLKASMIAAQEGSWNSARWLELLPEVQRSIAVSNEEERMIRTVEAGDMKLRALMEKLSGAKPAHF